jgi:ABC-type multidrug transport system ATPase subunit
VSEQLAYYGWLKGMRASEAKARCAEVLETVRLAPLANKRAAELSGGQLRRLGIAGALLHGADVILLDEPFAGLDPSQRESLDDALRAIPPAKIVVVSTHQTDDLNSVYGRTVVLSSGVIRFDGSTADFLQAGAGAKDEARAAYGAHVGAED